MQHPGYGGLAWLRAELGLAGRIVTVIGLTVASLLVFGRRARYPTSSAAA